jgi:hypothetical protein
VSVEAQSGTIADVLDRVRSGWSLLAETFAGLDEQELTAPGPEGWSVKDHLVHVSTWERALTTILNGHPQRVAFDLDSDAYDRIDSVDQLNAIIYKRYLERPLDEVLADSEQVHADMVAALERLTDADLDRSVADFGGDADDDRPIRQKIEGDSYEHYTEHVAWLIAVRSFILD